MSDDADVSSATPNGVDLLNAALDGLCSVMVGLHCLSHDVDHIFEYGRFWDYLFGLDGEFYGLGWRPHSDRYATQQPRPLWVSDWQTEVIAWLRTEDVETHGLSSEELVAAASQKLGGREFLMRPDSNDGHFSDAAAAADVMKYIPQHVEGLREGQATADKAIQAFPDTVLSALDGLRGGNWRTRLRREVLNVAGRWPGTKGQGMSACYVPNSPKHFIELVVGHDPRETWASYIDLIEDARADILAAGGEVPKAKPPETPIPTAPTPAPVHYPTDGAESPIETLRKLNRFDELMQAAQASRDLGLLPSDKTPPAELTQAAALWGSKETTREFRGLAETLAEEAEFYRCTGGGRCFALVARNWWQCINSEKNLGASINAHTLGQTIIELRAKLRAKIRHDSEPNAIKSPRSSESFATYSAAALTASFGGSGESGWPIDTEPVPPVKVANASPLERSLHRLQSRFSHGAKQHRPLAGVVVHSTSPAQRPQPDWPDAFVESLTQLTTLPGPSSESSQLRAPEDYAAVADRPFLDVSGEPLTTTAGEPIPFRPEWRRRLALYGERGHGAEYYADSVEAFMAIAAEAGRVVKDLPSATEETIWREWPAERGLPNEAGVWLAAVFELAWQKHKCSGLIAERKAWEGRNSATIEMLEDALAGKLTEPRLAEFAESIGVPSACWFSQLDNVWQASEAALDWMISVCQTREAERSLIEPMRIDTAQSRLPNGGSSSNSECPSDKTPNLKPSVEKAWATWKIAESTHPSGLLDRAAYDWLNEQDEELFVGVLSGYELPAFDTWSRYIRQARRVHEEHKNSPRSGRGTGRSVVDRTQI